MPESQFRPNAIDVPYIFINSISHLSARRRKGEEAFFPPLEDKRQSHMTQASPPQLFFSLSETFGA